MIPRKTGPEAYKKIVDKVPNSNANIGVNTS